MASTEPKAPLSSPDGSIVLRSLVAEALAAAEQEADRAVAVGGADREVAEAVAVEVAGDERGPEAAVARQLRLALVADTARRRRRRR